MKLGDFAEAISTRMWESVGRANWRKFEDARAFVHGLGLTTSFDWKSYARSDRRPPDIPIVPRRGLQIQGMARLERLARSRQNSPNNERLEALLMRELSPEGKI